jgi:hypothetical protein
MGSLSRAQLSAALDVAPNLPLRELTGAHSRMASTLAALFTSLSAAGTPFQLPEGVVLASVDTTYATQVLAAVAPAVPQADCHPVARAYAAAEAAITALTDEAGLLRCKLCATIAAACAVSRPLPARVTSLVQPIMAGLRRLPEACMHEEVWPGLTCFAMLLRRRLRLLLELVKCKPSAVRLPLHTCHMPGDAGSAQCNEASMTYVLSYLRLRAAMCNCGDTCGSLYRNATCCTAAR